MPKKYYNKTAYCTYFAFIWGIGWFGISYIFEGWGMSQITTLFQNPLGIGSVILVIMAVILFIWNLRREELTHEQWLELRDKRKPDLERFREVVGEYIKRTSHLIKARGIPALYDLTNYNVGTMQNPWAFCKETVPRGNLIYLRIRADDERLAGIKTEMENLASRLSSNKLHNFITQLYRRELIARSFQIFCRVYRAQYPIEPIVETYVLKSDVEGALAKYLKKIYSYIDFMERGKDLE